MDGEKYLQYLRTVHDRLSTRAEREGITKWALTAAGVYLITALAELIPALLDVRNGPSLTVVVFVHLFFFVDLTSMVLVPGGLKRKRSSDYRVFLQFDRSEIAVALFQISWLTLIPAVVGGSASVFVEGLGAWQAYTLRLNAVLFVVLYVGVMLFTASALRVVQSTGLPHSISLGLKESKLVRGVQLLFAMFVVSLAIMNAFWLVKTLGQVPREKISAVFVTAFYIFLLVYVFKYLIDAVTRARPLARIERLERDIMFNSLSDIEIRQRIEEELLGQELGSIVRAKIAHLRTHGDSLKNVLTEIQNYDVGSGAEARLKELADELVAKHGAYVKESGMLVSWFKGLGIRAELADDYVRQLLSETAKTLEELTEEMATRSSAARALIKKKFEQEKTQSASS